MDPYHQYHKTAISVFYVFFITSDASEAKPAVIAVAVSLPSGVAGKAMLEGNYSTRSFPTQWWE